MDRGTAVYRTPAEFFALTFPTYNLRELAKDVVQRLAGKNGKTIRQLELTYGGGTTHTLITLLHLVRDPRGLPDLPAVREFVQHIGMSPPRTEVAALVFDKLDAEKGMEVKGPAGELRWLRNPWSVLAFQIAGAEGLRLLHADGLDAERESAPAENLLVDLLAIPAKQDLATLILIDEVLMYAREKIGLDPAWRSRLVNFFQYLTQAATKIDRCAVVASLLASEPGKSDTMGKEIALELFTIFRREKEEGIQPVLKEDVAEILRRRFFVAESIRDREAFRPHVVAALKGVADHDEPTAKEGRSAEERFLKSYPFHPDLTEVFYTKWTQLEGFQRTRGILRTFALALRDAVAWDQCPLIGPNVFLNEPGKVEVSSAARELTNIAGSEEYEGKKQDWTRILEGELNKARAIQAETTGLSCREVEQAVFVTFLHSQPIGQKAALRDLTVLLGPTRPDKIQLEKALRRWTEVSWFLDEAAINDVPPAADGKTPLPKSWRLGSKPNLTQMHDDSRSRVSPDLIEAKLLKAIEALKSLTAGTAGNGCKVKVHNLPDKPNDITDDGDFHYAVLGPKAASTSGHPSAEARRFLEETTGSDRPRVNRNAVILAVPSREGLEVARTRIRDYLGWEEVQSQLKDQDVDLIRRSTLAANLDAAKKRIPEAVQQAYNIVVTVSKSNEVQAFKLTLDTTRPLFDQTKSDTRSRIQETAVSYEALLPNGPYDLWRSGETSRRVKDLVGAFAQFPHLPKMLNRQAILDTLIHGCREGQFVLRLTRPDRSTRTIWRQSPDESDLKNTTMEVVLPESAELSEIEPGLLCPNVLPDLWTGSDISVAEVRGYFSGGRVIKIARQGYDEAVTVPKAAQAVVDCAIGWAVKEGKLWLTSGPTSLYAEEIPAGLLVDDAQLQPPPTSISANDVLPSTLPNAWGGDETTVRAIAEALSAKIGESVPWTMVRAAIDGACQGRLLERTEDSGPWPCDYSGAREVKLRLPEKKRLSGGTTSRDDTPTTGVLVASAYLKNNEVQELADRIGDISNASVGYDFEVMVRIEVGSDEKRPPEAVVAKINTKLGEVSDNLKLT
ncbi:MAG: ATP-binding protein [Planctomycetaceae bacterium]|nr:ATP-binding protein [Planctomycetaceae bacterium]